MIGKMEMRVIINRIICDIKGEEYMSIKIEISRIYRFENSGPLKAFADIIVGDAFLIKGVKVIGSSNGLFVTMPQEQAKDKKWYDVVRCLSEEVRDKVTEVVLATYNEE